MLPERDLPSSVAFELYSCWLEACFFQVRGALKYLAYNIRSTAYSSSLAEAPSVPKPIDTHT